MGSEYKFKIELPIEKCVHCPCIQFYPLEDEYMCGIAQMRMLEEDLPGNGAATIPIEKMLKRYYKLRNWEGNGIPSQEKLKQLDISS